MAPIKFEDNIREKLEERKIQPSTEAWKKLNAQLVVGGEKKTNKVVWYAVAASFVGILIVAGVFFSGTSNSFENQKELVETNNLEKESTKQKDEFISETPNSKEINFNDVTSEEIPTLEQEKEKTKSIESTVQRQEERVVAVRITETESIEIAKVSNEMIKKEPQQSDEHKIISTEDIILDKKVDKLVAQIEQLQKENTKITTEEIDALLTNAQREIQTQRVLNSKKVDPAALLGDVEWELDKSFRDKVYDALSDGLVFIKTAVVERNN